MHEKAEKEVRKTMDILSSIISDEPLVVSIRTRVNPPFLLTPSNHIPILGRLNLNPDLAFIVSP